MAIPFRCPCGKNLTARDEFAGRRLRCPACRKVLAIPKSVSSATPPPSHEKIAAVAPDAQFVRFVCSCGRKLKALKGDVGSSIDCPTCGRELIIPLQDTQVRPEPVQNAVPIVPPRTSRLEPAPMTARAAPAPTTARAMPAAVPSTLLRPGSDSLVTQLVTPWRDNETRRAAGKPPPERKVRSLAWIPVALLLVAGLIGLEWYLGSQPSQAAPRGRAAAEDLGDLALVPVEAVSVQTMRVADILKDEPKVDAPGKNKSPKRTALSRLVKDTLDTHLANDDEQHTLLWSPWDIERLTVVVMPPDARRPVPLEPLGAPIGGKGPPAGKGKDPAVKGKDPGGKGKDPGGKAKDPAGKGKDPGGKGPPAPTSPQGNDVVVIVHTFQPISSADVHLRVLGRAGQVRLGKRSYWTSIDADRQLAVFLVSDQIMVIGDPFAVEHFMRTYVTEKPSPLAPAYKTARDHQALFAVNYISQLPANAKKDRVSNTAFMVLNETRTGQKKGLAIDVQVEFASAGVADAVKKDLDISLGKAAKALKLPANSYHTAATGTALSLILRTGEDQAEFAYQEATSFRKQVDKNTPLVSR